MTVWFDPGGGTKKKFGVRYPVVERGDPDAPGTGGLAGLGGGRARPRDRPPSDEPGAPTDRIDIIGPGKDDARSLTRGHLSGVDVAFRLRPPTAVLDHLAGIGVPPLEPRPP